MVNSHQDWESPFLQSPLEFFKAQNAINHSNEEIWNQSIHFIRALIVLKAVWGPMFPVFWINGSFIKTLLTLAVTQGRAAGPDSAHKSLLISLLSSITFTFLSIFSILFPCSYLCRSYSYPSVSVILPLLPPLHLYALILPPFPSW